MLKRLGVSCKLVSYRSKLYSRDSAYAPIKLDGKDFGEEQLILVSENAKATMGKLHEIAKKICNRFGNYEYYDFDALRRGRLIAVDEDETFITSYHFKCVAKSKDKLTRQYHFYDDLNDNYYELEFIK